MDSIASAYRDATMDQALRATLGDVAGARRALRSLSKRADELDSCCGIWSVLVYRQNPDASRAVPMRCKDRLCPACAQVRSATHRELVRVKQAEARGAGRWLKFVTLTQRADDSESSGQARDRMQAHVRRLMRRKCWKTWLGSGGGLLRYELTFKAGRGWHAHVHMLVELDFVPQATLAALWQDVTNGDGLIVDIRAASDGAENELLKYVLKAANLPAPQVVAFAIEMSGRRDSSTFGSWYGRRCAAVDAVLDDTEVPDAAALGPCDLMPLSHVERMAFEGDAFFARVRAAVARQADELHAAARSRELRRRERGRRRRRRRPMTWEPSRWSPDPETTPARATGG
jgi:hypothetical protein